MDEFPLRGFLLCSNCSRVLTGSASEGRKEYYHYYHCSSTCGCRYKADIVNDAFLKELKKYTLSVELRDLCSDVLLDVVNQETSGSKDIRKDILNQIDLQNERLKKGRELMLSSKIDPEDYSLIKKETEVDLSKLEAKMSEFIDNPFRIEEFIPKAVNVISNIADWYQRADSEGKSAIIGSMYPEKLHFDRQQHRNTRINEMSEVTYLISSAL